MGKTRALITGGAGFIGSHVADHVLALGMEVVVCDDLSGGYVENVPAGAQFVRGDLRSPDFVAALWELGPFDFVYHLAAYAAEGLSHFIRRYNYETNLLASASLINESIKHGVKCFVFTSSIAVYGKNQTPMVEDLSPVPEDPYGISKYAVELDLKAAHEIFGLPYIIFRPHNVYGERQNIADKYRNVIGIFMNQLIQGKPMTIFGDGSQTRAFSYIDDVAPLIARSPLESRAFNRVFNVGADTPHTVAELAKEVARAMNKPCDIQYLEARNEVLDAVADHSRARDVFSPPPPVSLQTGLKRMATWAIHHGARPPITFNRIEVREGLPPSWR